MNIADYSYDIDVNDLDLSGLDVIQTTIAVKTKAPSQKLNLEILDAAAFADTDTAEVAKAREEVRNADAVERDIEREKARVDAVLASLKPDPKGGNLDAFLKKLKDAMSLMSPPERAAILLQVVYTKLFNPILDKKVSNPIYKDSTTAPVTIKALATALSQMNDGSEGPAVDSRVFPLAESFVRDSRAGGLKEVPLNKFTKFVESLNSDGIKISLVDLKNRVRSMISNTATVQFLSDNAGKNYESAFNDKTLVRFMVGAVKETKAKAKTVEVVDEATKLAKIVDADTEIEERAQRMAAKRTNYEDDYDRYYDDI
jgi:hypothetical protein